MKSPPPTLFRHSSWARVRSPEQLDSLLSATAPLGWLALLAIALVVAAVTGWAFFGTILRTTHGEGMIVRDGDITFFELAAQGSGTVGEMLVGAGDQVEAGQVVARFNLPSLDREITSRRAMLEELQGRDARQTRSEEERVQALQQERVLQEKLAARGEGDTPALLAIREAIDEVQARLFDRRQRVLEQELQLGVLETRRREESLVAATRAGRITEVFVRPGDFVQPGKALARVESLEGEKGAVIYLPTAEGQKAAPGMKALIAPSTVAPEEYGYLLAEVASISGYPVTREALLGQFGGDERMVDALMANGSVLQLVVNFKKDPATPSGFAWSSSQGPPLALESGTLCRASIVLERVRPISLVAPFFKRQFGFY